MKLFILYQCVISSAVLVSLVSGGFDDTLISRIDLSQENEVAYEVISFIGLSEAVADFKKDLIELEVDRRAMASRSFVGNLWNGFTGFWTRVWDGVKEKSKAIDEALTRTWDHVERIAGQAVKKLLSMKFTEIIELIGGTIKATVIYIGQKVINGGKELFLIIDKNVPIILEKIKNGENVVAILKSVYHFGLEIGNFVHGKVVEYYQAKYVDAVIDITSLVFSFAGSLRAETDSNFKVIYQDNRLGTINATHPIMHLGIKPDLESVVETTMHLQQTAKCPNKPDKTCLQSIIVDWKKMNVNASVIPQCDHLTVTIHGWREHPNHGLSEALSEYYGQKYASFCNLAIDWSSIARGKYFWEVNFFDEGELSSMCGDSSSFFPLFSPIFMHLTAVDTITVGRQVAVALHDLISMKKVSADEIHLIGSTLGAHVAHFASEWLQVLGKADKESKIEDWKPGRITGLDPTSFFFEGHEGAHLTSEDAGFVDVIHTSSVDPNENEVWNLIRGRLGFSEDIGHIDFHPNTGRHPQHKNCDKLELWGPIHLVKLGWNFLDAALCSSRTAVDYFIASMLREDGKPRQLGESRYPSHRCKDVLLEKNNPPDLVRGDKKSSRVSMMGILATEYKGEGRHCLNADGINPPSALDFPIPGINIRK